MSKIPSQISCLSNSFSNFLFLKFLFVCIVVRAVERSGPYNRLALAICNFDPEQAEGPGLGEKVFRAVDDGDDLEFNPEYDYNKRFREEHHKVLQLAHWSPTPERDQSAANALHALFTVFLNHKDVFSASAPSAREMLADPQKLARHQEIIGTCHVAAGSSESCTTLLERCTGNVDVAAVAAERLITCLELVRSKFSGFIAQVADRISTTELVTNIEKVIEPVNQLHIRHGSTEETFDYLGHAEDFLATFTEQMADKLSEYIEPIKGEVSDAMLLSTSFDQSWLGLSAQQLTSVKAASNAIIKGKVETMIWCFLQLISLPQITGPRGKKIRDQLKAVKTKMMSEPDVMKGVPKSVQDKADDIIAIDKKKVKVSNEGTEAIQDSDKTSKPAASSQPSADALIPITVPMQDEVQKFESMMLGGGVDHVTDQREDWDDDDDLDGNMSEALLFRIIPSFVSHHYVFRIIPSGVAFFSQNKNSTRQWIQRPGQHNRGSHRRRLRREAKAAKLRTKQLQHQRLLRAKQQLQHQRLLKPSPKAKGKVKFQGRQRLPLPKRKSRLQSALAEGVPFVLFV